MFEMGCGDYILMVGMEFEREGFMSIFWFVKSRVGVSNFYLLSYVNVFIKGR